jgi:UDP-N-acetyl-D-mannosaminuronate dehydrogenase
VKTVLVVGLGEVGMALYEIIKESGKYDVYGLDLIINLNQQIPSKVDIIHICYPYSNDGTFIKSVIQYVGLYNPDLIIINSTIKPRTIAEISKKCECKIAFSPVFGTHRGKEYFKEEIKYYGKFVGGIDEESTKLTMEHFNKIGIFTLETKTPLEAEIIKLYCTTYYGMIVALSQEFHRFSRSMGADYEEVIKGICYLHSKAFNKPPAYPDAIGGHCVLPNIDIILSCYDSDLIKSLLNSNEKRKEDLKDPDIRAEMEKVKVIVDKFWKDLHDKNRKVIE